MTQLAFEGLSENEIGRARISVMARAICSTRGPDTEAQDQSPPLCRFSLQRTAGPYSWVTGVALCKRRLPVNFRYAPIATEVSWRCNMSRRAKLRRQSPYLFGRMSARLLSRFLRCWIAAELGLQFLEIDEDVSLAS